MVPRDEPLKNGRMQCPDGFYAGWLRLGLSKSRTGCDFGLTPQQLPNRPDKRLGFLVCADRDAQAIVQTRMSEPPDEQFTVA